MSNTSPPIVPSPVRTPAKKGTGRRPGRPSLVLTADTWASVTDALRSPADLATLADIAEVSIPTVRKQLVARFGARVKFGRGRKGGVSLIA